MNDKQKMLDVERRLINLEYLVSRLVKILIDNVDKQHSQIEVFNFNTTKKGN